MKERIESFAGRMTRRVVLTVLVTMTIISVAVFIIAAYGMLVFTKAHYSDVMDKAKANMSMLMSNVEISAENIIDELSWHLATPELVSSTLAYELNTNRHLYGCGIGFIPDYYPAQGRWFEPYASVSGDSIMVRNIGSETHDYLNAEWYTRGLAYPQGVWSNPYLDEEGAGTVLCTYTRLVNKEPDGGPAGIFGADISLDGLSELTVEHLRPDNEASPFIRINPDDSARMIYSFIIGPDGDFIVHPDKERILKANFYDFAKGRHAEKYSKLGDAMRSGEEGEMRVTIDGIRAEVFYAPLLHSGWSMAIVVPTSRVVTPSLIYGSLILFLILLGILIVFLACNRSIKKASKPLIQLAESAREVATGNFATELPDIRTNDELGLLRDSFDNMQKSLAQYVEELTETTAKKASIENELVVARNIQMSMLPMTWPAFPEREDLDIFGSLTPAKAVGGDLYDFRIRDGKLFFCIGDVSGKGIPASLVMCVIGSLFRTISASEDSPVKIATSLNSSMSSRNVSMMFVTMFVGVLDLATGKLQYTNAGHNAPVLVSGNKAEMLKVDSNVALGIMGDWEYSLQELTLSTEDVLFLYTDGLTEATRVDGQLFEEKRVLENLSGNDGNIPVSEIISRMTAAVGEFVGDAEQSDDLTMMAFRLTR